MFRSGVGGVKRLGGPAVEARMVGRPKTI